MYMQYHRVINAKAIDWRKADSGWKRLFQSLFQMNEGWFGPK